MTDFIVTFMIGLGWSVAGTYLFKAFYDKMHYHSYTETKKRKDRNIDQYLRQQDTLQKYLKGGYSRRSTVSEKVKEIMELQTGSPPQKFITTEEIERMRDRVLGRGQKVKRRSKK
jgi:hypothetical protein